MRSIKLKILNFATLSAYQIQASSQVGMGQGRNYTGTPGDFVPEMQKRALEKRRKKSTPENCHRLQCKSLFNVADLVNGM